MVDRHAAVDAAAPAGVRRARCYGREMRALLPTVLLTAACSQAAPPCPPQAPPAPVAVVAPAAQAPSCAAVPEAPTSADYLELARCEERAGRLVDALKASERALAGALQAREKDDSRAAYDLTKDLIARTPHVAFAVDPRAEDVVVSFDGRVLAADRLAKKLLVDPGEHAIEASGTRGGHLVRFAKQVRIAEREAVKVDLRLE